MGGLRPPKPPLKQRLSVRSVMLELCIYSMG
jgi:hypothetical protein